VANGVSQRIGRHGGCSRKRCMAHSRREGNRDIPVITKNWVHARPASLRGCGFPSAGYRGVGVGDRSRTHRSWCW
jgi:hypothetical protein